MANKLLLFAIHIPLFKDLAATQGKPVFQACLDLNVWLAEQCIIQYGVLVTAWPQRGTSQGEMEVVKTRRRHKGRKGLEKKEDKSVMKPTVAAWEVSKGRSFTLGSLQWCWHYFSVKICLSLSGFLCDTAGKVSMSLQLPCGGGEPCVLRQRLPPCAAPRLCTDNPPLPICKEEQ